MKILANTSLGLLLGLTLSYANVVEVRNVNIDPIPSVAVGKTSEPMLWGDNLISVSRSDSSGFFYQVSASSFNGLFWNAEGSFELPPTKYQDVNTSQVQILHASGDRIWLQAKGSVGNPNHLILYAKDSSNNWKEERIIDLSAEGFFGGNMDSFFSENGNKFLLSQDRGQLGQQIMVVDLENNGLPVVRISEHNFYEDQFSFTEDHVILLNYHGDLAIIDLNGSGESLFSGREYKHHTEEHGHISFPYDYLFGVERMAYSYEESDGTVYQARSVIDPEAGTMETSFRSFKDPFSEVDFSRSPYEYFSNGLLHLYRSETEHGQIGSVEVTRIYSYDMNFELSRHSIIADNSNNTDVAYPQSNEIFENRTIENAMESGSFGSLVEATPDFFYPRPNLFSAHENFSYLQQIDSLVESETWFDLSGIGPAEISNYPWVYSPIFGWTVYTQNVDHNNQEGFGVFFSELQRWLYTPIGQMQYFFDLFTQKWYYLTETDGNVWLYDFGKSSWLNEYNGGGVFGKIKTLEVIPDESPSEYYNFNYPTYDSEKQMYSGNGDMSYSITVDGIEINFFLQFNYYSQNSESNFNELDIELDVYHMDVWSPTHEIEIDDSFIIDRIGMALEFTNSSGGSYQGVATTLNGETFPEQGSFALPELW